MNESKAPPNAPVHPQGHTRTFEDVRAVEHEEIKRQRKERGVPKKDPLVGLALSGGGIRSSTFGLGVLQAFAEKKYFRRIDYLSTVSGGGFIGTSLGWFLKMTGERFPFLDDPRNKGDDPKDKRDDDDHLIGVQTLDYLRLHADYLDQRTPPPRPHPHRPEAKRPASSFTLMSLVAVVIQMMAVTLFVYGGSIILGFVALDSFDHMLRPVKAIIALQLHQPSDAPWLDQTNFAMVVGVALGLFYLLVGGASSIVKFTMTRVRLVKTPPQDFSFWSFLAFLVIAPWSYLYNRIRRRPSLKSVDQALKQQRAYQVRLKTEAWAGWLLSGSLLAMLIGSVPLVETWVGARVDPEWIRSAMWTLVLGAGGMTSIFQSRSGSATGLSGWIRSATFTNITAYLTLYAGLLAAHAIAALITDSRNVWLLWVILGGIILIGLLSNINSLGSHKMYRDRLMETFMPEREGVIDGYWRPSFEATGTSLADSGTKRGPFHLLNTSVTTTHSSNPQLHNRGADSFQLSHLYSGSPGTGWTLTKDWPLNEITTATAMAVSAAAVNPGTAMSGAGPTRGWAVSTVLTLLNLRLGYWTENPDRDYRPRFRLPPALIHIGRWLRPYLCLLPPPLGFQLREDAPFIELADGGGFDNTGIYELVRRRCDVIVVSDATGDEHYDFASLGDVLERLWADFTVSVEFDQENGLKELRPGSGPSDALEKHLFSDRAHAVGAIKYPDHEGEDAKEAVLILLKPAVVPGLPLDVLAYKTSNPAFPNQGTLDQFFDERQYEAYRKLGFVVGKKMLEDDHVQTALGSIVEEGAPLPAEEPVAG